MKSPKLSFTAFLLLVALGAENPAAWGQSYVRKVVINEKTNYCHLKFPAIRPETLRWDRPILADPSESLVDFYGACDYDPLGKEAIQKQKLIIQRERHREPDD